jgi:tetratricopeptide (TPR) repeat protein
MDKDTSEIAKLTERIAKDPRSKLFVPLAEEYKKAGDMEMSIHVLREGLNNNPGYVTARSFLGKLLIEKGDLAGAQNEFEEVVKAIPDNLMAQRKLGDLYALQDRPSDAVRHYKAVLAINPKDSETAMLIAEADAGRDIKKYIAKPKTAPVEEPQKKQEPTKSPSAAKTEIPPSAPPKKSPAVPAMTAVHPEEEPEEVLVVEPLDAAEPAGKAAVPREFDFLAEPVSDGERREEVAVNAAVDPFAVQPDAGAQEAEEPGSMPFDLNEPFATGMAVPDAPEFRDEVVAETGKQADDFTTDTLAELYISQGFFEKAVDIYERMLVDNPNSQGLKDKLANVRAMAAAAPAGEDAAEIIPVTIPSDSLPEEESGETDTGKVAPGAEGIPPLEGAPQARLDDWELPAAKTIPAIDRESPRPARPPAPPKPFDVGFEPREYVPPDAVMKKTGAPEEKHKTREKPAASPVRQAAESENAPHSRTAAKQETVDRLESWLKNIMKEK